MNFVEHWGKISTLIAAGGFLIGAYTVAATRGLPVFANDLQTTVSDLKKGYDERLTKGEKYVENLTRSLNGARVQTNALRKIIVEGEIIKNETDLQRSGLDPGHQRFLRERVDALKEELEDVKKERNELKNSGS
jgi:hypothetical protein